MHGAVIEVSTPKKLVPNSHPTPTQDCTPLSWEEKSAHTLFPVRCLLHTLGGKTHCLTHHLDISCPSAVHRSPVAAAKGAVTRGRRVRRGSRSSSPGNSNSTYTSTEDGSASPARKAPAVGGQWFSSSSFMPGSRGISFLIAARICAA